MSQINWKVPRMNLTVGERAVLNYLTEHALDEKLNRCIAAMSEALFPSSYSSGMQRVSKHLRVLNAMGLIERVKHHSLVYYNRLKEDDTAAVHGDEWIDKTGNNLGVFKVWESCAAFQYVGSQHPNPINLEKVRDDVLWGEATHKTMLILKLLVTNGFLDVRYGQGKIGEKRYAPTRVWLTERGLDIYSDAQSRRSDSSLVMEHLKKYADKPEMGRLKNIAVEALGMQPDANKEEMERRMNPILRDLEREGHIYRAKHDIGKFDWYRAVGSAPIGRPKKTEKKKGVQAWLI